MNLRDLKEVRKYINEIVFIETHIQNKTLLFKMEGVPICENNSILK